ncbi:MAG TPA: hypothetical protein VL527_05385 [Dongiaceae bacterium]|nr:hypothetical protein [Dongiaceae bacterium]
MKPVTMHIGGPNNFDTVLRLIYPRFDAFTFLDDPVNLREGRKSGLAVRIDRGDDTAILDAAAALRVELGAENVEIEYAGLR